MVRYHVCYNCKNRTIGCHAKCELYIKEQKENREIKEKIHEEKEIIGTLIQNGYKRVSTVNNKSILKTTRKNPSRKR